MSTLFNTAEPEKPQEYTNDNPKAGIFDTPELKEKRMEGLIMRFAVNVYFDPQLIEGLTMDKKVRADVYSVNAVFILLTALPTDWTNQYSTVTQWEGDKLIAKWTVIEFRRKIFSDDKIVIT
jgi:hypothetical protein